MDPQILEAFSRLVGGARKDPDGGTGGWRSDLAGRDGSAGEAVGVGFDAGLDCGVIATEQARDLREAAVALGVVTDPRPDLVAGAGDPLRASATAELDEWHATSGGDIDEALHFYTTRYLVDDILVKADRASMLASLEVCRLIEGT